MLPKFKWWIYTIKQDMRNKSNMNKRYAGASHQHGDRAPSSAARLRWPRSFKTQQHLKFNWHLGVKSYGYRLKQKLNTDARHVRAARAAVEEDRDIIVIRGNPCVDHAERFRDMTTWAFRTTVAHSLFPKPHKARRRTSHAEVPVFSSF